MPPTPLEEVLFRHEIRLLVRFGSSARGTARSDSDVDVGAERSDGRPMTLHELGALRSDLEPLLGTSVDLVDLVAADCILRFEVLKDGVLLHDAGGRAWSEFASRTLIDHDDIAWHLPGLVAGVGRAATRGRRS